MEANPRARLAPGKTAEKRQTTEQSKRTPISRSDYSEERKEVTNMVKSMYAAITGLRSHQSKLDVISNNMANVNTWGYKSRSANFADAMYQNSIQGSGGQNRNGYSGGMNTSQLGFGVNMGSISTDFTTGSWSPTGNGLHCMINGPSFFIVGPFQVKDDAGANKVGISTNLKNEGVSLSRVGIFNIDNNGYLVDDQGNYVYGYRCTNPGVADQESAFTNDKTIGSGNNAATNPGFIEPDQNQLQPIRIPSVDANGNVVIDDGTGERLKIQSYTIAQDGTIVGIDDASKPYVIGKIAVAHVENPNGLEQDAGYLYKPGNNAGAVEPMEAGSEAVGKILSGYLEMANVDLAVEISEMIKAQRGYQANTKVITVTDEMLEQLVNMKR